MDNELHKVYEYMKLSSGLWPDEITGESLKAAFKNGGSYNGSDGANYWASVRGVDVGKYPNQKHYTWTRIAKFFREAENESDDTAG